MIKKIMLVDEADKKEFGEWLRAQRLIAGLSQTEFAKKVGRGCSKQAISLYENGIYAPRLPRMKRLAKALGITFKELEEVYTKRTGE